MERDYCPWCNTGFSFEPEHVREWPLVLFCFNCNGEMLVKSRIDYAVERGYKLPPSIVNHTPRI